MALEDLVVSGSGAHHARQPAAPGTAQAEQAHDVTRIGVEGQVGAGLVAAHVDVTIAAAVVVDVTQEVALGILGHRVAEIEAHGPEDHADLGGGGVRRRAAAQGRRRRGTDRVAAAISARWAGSRWTIHELSFARSRPYQADGWRTISRRISV